MTDTTPPRLEFIIGFQNLMSEIAGADVNDPRTVSQLVDKTRAIATTNLELVSTLQTLAVLTADRLKASGAIGSCGHPDCIVTVQPPYGSRPGMIHAFRVINAAIAGDSIIEFFTIKLPDAQFAGDCTAGLIMACAAAYQGHVEHRDQVWP